MALSWRAALTLAALLCLRPAVVSAQNDKSKADSKPPTLSLKASPGSGIAPVRVSLTGELKGGADDSEEYYCPSVEWDWGDGTVSESSSDCDPYEAGKTTIARRFTVQHVFRASGALRVQLRLKKKEKVVASAVTNLQIVSGGLP